jgi:hypothetical protein
MSADNRIIFAACNIFERPMNEIQVIGVLQEVRENEIKNAKYHRVVQILGQICKGVCYLGSKPPENTYNYPARLAEYNRKVELHATQRLEHHPKFDGENGDYTIEGWDLYDDGRAQVCLEWSDYDGGSYHKYLDLPASWMDLKDFNFMGTVKEDVIKARWADDDAKAFAAREAAEKEILKKKDEIERLQVELDKKRAELKA